jgi:heme/copper-type cytochrome/quinol oxidase subunit 4
VTAFAIILGCIALMLVVASVRGNPGRAIADTALLVIVLAIIVVVNLILAQFMDTGDTGKWVAIAFAGGFALDSLYGLMAPERQKRRDKKLRRLMKRRT